MVFGKKITRHTLKENMSGYKKGIGDCIVNVLSLFDGMSCGMVAMLNAGVNIGTYYAYEIDKYAIKTSQHNFPQIKQCGNVFEGDYTQYEDIDYLIGGSPCTHWSIAQSPDKRETTASGIGWDLFSQYVRALREAKPKYFIYENNKSMSKEIRKSITETFGFEDICINSALVSAQNRQRLYWVGKRNDDGTYSKVDVGQPEDKGIVLRDILDGVTDRDKGRCVIGSTGRTTEREYFKKNQGNMAFEPIGTTIDNKSFCLTARYYKGFGNNPGRPIEKHRDTMGAEPVSAARRGRYNESGTEQHVECRTDNKANCITTAQKDSMVVEPVRNSIQVGALPRPNGELSTSQAFRIYDTNAKSVTLKAGGGGAGGKTGLYAIPISPNRVGEIGNGGQGNRIYSIDGKSVTQQANSGGIGSHTGLYAIPVGESKTVLNGIDKISKKLGYVPEMFNAYNVQEITDKSPTLTTGSMETSSCATNRFENIDGYAMPVEFQNGVPTKAISGVDGKVYKVYEVKDRQITIKERQYPVKLQDGYYIIRKLTVSECKRLQTVPEWYEFPVSDSRAYQMLGNGWTCDVITHLITSTLK